MTKDLGNGSLQVGKDYWELGDWSTSHSISTEWSKRRVEEILKEKDINFYWGEWHIIQRDGHY